MSTTTAHEPTPASIEALLDRLDPAAADRCDVPGCHHHHVERIAAPWAGSALAA